MKYKCLVLDHDDTVVDSTASIHYPSFLAYVAEYRPHLLENYDRDTFYRKNFDPGIFAIFRDELGLSDEELEEEDRFWREYVKKHIPRAFDGFSEIIDEYLTRGGTIAVVSHSYRDYIERDYRENGLKMPTLVYGWELPAEQRKPSPYPLLDIMNRLSLEPSDILVVDDLKPGYDMARAAGCDFAAAGWAYDVPEIEAFMRANCDYYLPTVESLSDLLFK